MRAVGLEEHLVIAGVRDRSSRGEGGDTRAFGRAQSAVHTVAVQERVPALGVKTDHGVEIVAAQLAVGPGATDSVEEVSFAPRLRHAGRHDLLGQDVERSPGDRGTVEDFAIDRDE